MNVNKEFAEWEELQEFFVGLHYAALRFNVFYGADVLVWPDRALLDGLGKKKGMP